MSLRILSQVGGQVSRKALMLLTALAKDLPEDGAALDLYCGEGRSTIALATALEASENAGATVLAVDTHITNPLSQNPHEDGTIQQFFRHLRRFKVLHRVIPVMASVSVTRTIFNKRSFNLVVVQTPAHGIEDALAEGIDIAQYAVRVHGKIAVLRPVGLDMQTFRRFIEPKFGPEFVLDMLADEETAIYQFTGDKNVSDKNIGDKAKKEDS